MFFMVYVSVFLAYKFGTEAEKMSHKKGKYINKLKKLNN